MNHALHVLDVPAQGLNEVTQITKILSAVVGYASPTRTVDGDRITKPASESVRTNALGTVVWIFVSSMETLQCHSLGRTNVCEKNLLPSNISNIQEKSVLLKDINPRSAKVLEDLSCSTIYASKRFKFLNISLLKDLRL